MHSNKYFHEPKLSKIDFLFKNLDPFPATENLKGIFRGKNERFS